MSREFISRCVNRSSRNTLGDRINFPAHQTRQCVTKWTQQIITHHEVIETHIKNNLAVGRVIRVHRMEHITHGHVNPHDVCCGSFPRHQPDTISIVGVPSEGETTSKSEIKVDQNGLIVNDNVTIGDRHVVHHRHTRQWNINRAIHATVFTNTHILHMIHPLGPRINDGMHLAGYRINFRMRSECTRQCSKKVIASDGFKFVVQFHWTSTSFDHRPRGARK